MTLALKYRPKVWSDLIGQETSAKILSSMLTKGKWHPVLVFGGPRGVGKTTVCRVFAKSVNCLNRQGADPCNECDICKAIEAGTCPDVIELDAASNGGVNSVRQLRETALYAPVQAKIRVFILDEAHAMTREAFQAMLKVLEEPPPNTVFMMATTEPSQIPETILSRSLIFEFRRLSAGDIYRRLRYVCDQENIEAENDALQLISHHVSGGMRDALMILEQAASMGVSITQEFIASLLGLLSRSELASLFTFILEGRRVKVILWSREVFARGVDPLALLNSLLSFVRELITVHVGYHGSLNVEEYNRLEEVAQKFGTEGLLRISKQLTDLNAAVARSAIPSDILIDLFLARIALDEQLRQRPDPVVQR